MQVPSITTQCQSCGVWFEQADDPGRRRQYCGNACRQRAYRARSGKTGHESRARSQREQAEAQARADEAARQRREDQARWARENRQRRREQEAQRAGASWTHPVAGEPTRTAKARATCRKLLERANHAKTPAPEATACREKAETIRQRHGL